MSRYTGPKTRINRKFSKPIFTPKKAFERKPYLPGMHGPRLRRKMSDYALGLKEKQCLKYMYGLTEKQFKLTFDKAKHKKGITGEVFLQMLELRLDNIVYLLGFATSRPAARQLVGHGHIIVNNKKTDIPSFICKVGDIISVKNKISSKQVVTTNLDLNQHINIPIWLSLEKNNLKGTLSRIPSREDIRIDINEQLIVEFYNR